MSVTALSRDRCGPGHMLIHLPLGKELLAACVAGNAVVMERALNTYQNPEVLWEVLLALVSFLGSITALLNCVSLR